MLSWSLAPGWPMEASSSSTLAQLVPADALRGPRSGDGAGVGVFAVTRVLPFAGADGGRPHREFAWRVLDVVYYPDDDALRQAMIEHYAQSRMPYWPNLIKSRPPTMATPEDELEKLLTGLCTPLSKGELTPTAAMPLFAGWLMRAVRAAAAMPAGSHILRGIDEPAWSKVLADAYDNDSDREEAMEVWPQESVWLCVHQSTLVHAIPS